MRGIEIVNLVRQQHTLRQHHAKSRQQHQPPPASGAQDKGIDQRTVLHEIRLSRLCADYAGTCCPETNTADDALQKGGCRQSDRPARLLFGGQAGCCIQLPQHLTHHVLLQGIAQYFAFPAFGKNIRLVKQIITGQFQFATRNQ